MIQCSVTNTSAWHSNSQASSIPTAASISVSVFRGLIDQLVECRVDVIRELDLSDGSHAFSSQPNTEAHDTLFC